MLQQYSELCLPGQYAKESRAGQYKTPREGQTGDSDIRLHHIPEDCEFLDHKYDDTPIELFMRQGLSR
jgi:hypothetical protein